MQPRRATRGIAAVAVSSAGAGILLLALALLLAACGASPSRPAAASSTSSAPRTTTSTAAPSTASTTGPGTGSATASPTTGSGGPVASSAPSDQVVPTVPVTTAPAVPLTAPAPAASGGSITIGTVTAIQGTAQLPGEVAGPAVRVPVTLVNGEGTTLDLDQIVVDLVDHTGVSAGQLTASPAEPFAGDLAPGATARATYVFSLATDDRNDVRIVVSYTTTAPVVVFTGDLA